MAGDALLVAPILADGARSRTLLLPKGTWFDFESGNAFPGGEVVSLDAPLSRIPVLVRDGCVVPDVSGRTLTLHLYPPASGSSRASMLYSDAGDGYGDCRIDRFVFSGSADSLELAWTHEGDYPWPFDTLVIQLHGSRADRVTIDGRDALLQDGFASVHAFSGLSASR
jgi:alpha-glucosidase